MPTCKATRHLLALLFLAMIAATAQATWSIAATHRATGGVVVASATCLSKFDLKKGTPVMLVGIGGAAAQSALDGNGTNRKIIWDELQKGTAPVDILAILAQQDPQHQMRQYGIVDMQGRPVSFSGS